MTDEQIVALVEDGDFLLSLAAADRVKVALRVKRHPANIIERAGYSMLWRSARWAVDRYPSAGFIRLRDEFDVVCDKEFVAGSDTQCGGTVDPVFEDPERAVAAGGVFGNGAGAFFRPTRRAIRDVEISRRVEGQSGRVTNSAMNDTKRTLRAWMKHFDDAATLGAFAGQLRCIHVACPIERDSPDVQGIAAQSNALAAAGRVFFDVFVLTRIEISPSVERHAAHAAGVHRKQQRAPTRRIGRDLSAARIIV